MPGKSPEKARKMPENARKRKSTLKNAKTTNYVKFCKNGALIPYAPHF